MKEYETFLKKYKKVNGDKLLPSTIEAYNRVISKYEEDLINLNEKELLDFFNIEIVRKPSMILYSSFRMFLKMYLIKNNLIDIEEEIFKNLKTPIIYGKGTETSIRKLQQEVISEQELRILYKNVNKYWKMVISIMYDTACRKSELLQLKFNSIIYKDLNNKKHKKDIENGIYAEVNVIGKGFKQRTLYLTKNTTELIQEYSKGKKDDEYIIRLYQENGTIYENQEYEFWNRIVKIHKKFLERYIHPHTYRHTRLQHMANKGVNVLQIASYAGHSNIKTTMKYVHNSTFQGMQGWVQSIIDLSDGEKE
jgi:integrase